MRSQRVRHDWATELNWTEQVRPVELALWYILLFHFVTLVAPCKKKPKELYLVAHVLRSELEWSFSKFMLSPLSLPVQFSSVAQSCVTLCDSMDHSMPGLPVHHQLPEFTQTHLHWAGDAIQPSHPLSSPSPAFNLSQYQGLFKWVSSSHQVAEVLELQLQHQSFQWTPRTDLL